MSSTEMTKWQEQLATAEKEMLQMSKKLTALRKAKPTEAVKDYDLYDGDGQVVKLSSLFGEQNELVVIHNMGQGCPYCTLWADGFNGTVDHFENRAPFVLVTPDAPAKMKEFTTGRGWKFRSLSNNGGDFTKNMGYADEKGSQMPGFSTFYKDDSGQIFRSAHTWFGPGDYFSPIWHILDLLKEGQNGWAPKFSYK